MPDTLPGCGIWDSQVPRGWRRALPPPLAVTNPWSSGHWHRAALPLPVALSLTHSGGAVPSPCAPGSPEGNDMGSSIYNPCLPPTRQAEAVPDTSLHGRGIVTLGLRVPLLHEENLSFLKDISFYFPGGWDGRADSSLGARSQSPCLYPPQVLCQFAPPPTSQASDGILPTHKASVTKVTAMSSLWGERGGGAQWTGGGSAAGG